MVKKKLTAEDRYIIFNRDRFLCQHCESSVYKYGTPQAAHRLSNSKSNRKKYGDFINSPANCVAACCMDCNDHLAYGVTKQREFLIENGIIDE